MTFSVIPKLNTVIFRYIEIYDMEILSVLLYWNTNTEFLIAEYS